jgi:hypothetical protein
MRQFWAICHSARPDGRPPRSWPLHLRQRRLGLREPEGPLHSAVHFDSHRQRGLGLLSLADLGIQRTKAPVAVRLERAHAQCVD